jgi:hypothetical protein
LHAFIDFMYYIICKNIAFLMRTNRKHKIKSKLGLIW